MDAGMNEKIIFITVLIISFLQILHIFEEIALGGYTYIKKKNPRGIYLRVASVLVFLNYVVLFLLYAGYTSGYYAAFYSVLISSGNTIAHIVIFFKIRKKGTYGYGLPSSIPLGAAGLVLLYYLILYLSHA
jgi:hypothetical protein